LTETEWLASEDPTAMLDWLRQTGKGSDRRLRLFAIASVLRVSQLLTPQAHEALDVAERFAEGLARTEDRKAAREAALSAGVVGPSAMPLEMVRHARGPAKASACWTLARRGIEAAKMAVYYSSQAERQFRLNKARANSDSAWAGALAEQMAARAALLRDIFGNPFRAAPVMERAWLKPDVVELAQPAYDQRSFERMPELATALEKAGCNNRDVLGHYRLAGEHVKGCWVVDLVLGKE
jgi:hypothetical protein